MKGETAEQIRKTAHALMLERGYSAFSYADISEAIKITKASIHHHFPTKAGLAVAVLQAHREGLIHGTEMLDQQFADPAARLRAYVRHWEGCIRDKTVTFCVAALLGAELPALPEEVQTEVRLHFTTLLQWVERTLREGVKKHVLHLQATVAVEAQMLIAVVHGAMLTARASGTCEVFKEVTTAALKRIAAKASD